MNPFESTIEDPLRFLKEFINGDGYSYISELFEISNDPEFKYDSERNVIIAQGILPRGDIRGELLDDETNTREYEITFPEYVSNEFDRQFDITKILINNLFHSNSDEQNRKRYRMILIDCLKQQKIADSNPDLPFKHDINRYLLRVLNYSIRKFNPYYSGLSELTQVNRYYQKQKSNLTGFKLKIQLRNGTVDEFIDFMKDQGFIDRRTHNKSVKEFLDGNIPHTKINWIRDLHELVGFINILYDDSILVKKPGQRWKYLYEIFVWKGIELEFGWNRNHNYLKSEEKIRRIQEAIDFLRPRN